MLKPGTKAYQCEMTSAFCLLEKPRSHVLLMFLPGGIVGSVRIVLFGLWFREPTTAAQLLWPRPQDGHKRTEIRARWVSFTFLNGNRGENFCRKNAMAAFFSR